MKVVLTSEQIGTMTPDLITYPQLDVEGKEYTRGMVNTHGIGNSQFVVIPASKDGDDWQFELPLPEKKAKG